MALIPNRLRSFVKRSYSARFLAWLAVFNLVDLAAIARARRAPPGDKKRVVFIKLDGIGDYVIWTSSFDRLAAIYPEGEFERILVGNLRWQSLAEDEDLFDHKIFVDTDRFVADIGYRYANVRRVRELGADVAVNPRLTRELLWSDSLVRATGAPQKIGSRGLDNLMIPLADPISARWYTKLVDAPEPDQHELVSMRKFLDVLDPASTLEPQLPRLPLEETPIVGDYAVLVLGAFNHDRRWPIERFADVASHLSKEHGLDIVLCGGPADRLLAEKFAEICPQRAIDLIGQTSLHDLGSLLGGARLTVTNDTGVAHIAVAAGCATVVVTPGNQVGRFFPYPGDLQTGGARQLSVFHEMPCFGCGWTCIYKDLAPDEPKPCIAGITADDVIAACDAVLRPPAVIGTNGSRRGSTMPAA